MKALTAAFILFAAATALHATSPDPRALLARAKEAAGGSAWDAVKALHTRAQLSASGLSGTVESWEDVLGGRFVTTFQLGPVSGAEGYDGTTSWSVDPSGQARVNDSGDAREGAVNDAYRRSLAYWYPERRPASVAYVEEREEGERSFHVVRIRPEGGRFFDVWIDAKTFHLDRTVEQGGREVRTTFFSDYRTVDGLKLPFSQRSTNGEAKYDTVVTVESVEVNPALDTARFRMPEGKTDDFAIAAGATSATVPFELLNNHLYVDAHIDGTGPHRVLLDTGGMNIVTPATAQRLGLKTEGTIQGRGAGEKTEDVGLSRVRELRLGDVTLKDQVFYVFPLAGLDDAEGVDFSGLIGYEVFKRFVVRVDYTRRLLTLTLPEAFTPPTGATAVPFTFNGQTPQVEGSIDGLPGKFTIDTGSRVSLTLHRPFAEAHGLKAKYAPKVEAMTGYGVGGAVRAAVTRAGVLKLGGVEVKGPVAEIPLVEKGAFTDRYLAGNVGGGVLKRFAVTFDYSRQTIYFEPNAEAGQPDPFDRAGLWLNRAAGGYRVEDVVPGGPATAAGLQVGDLVTAVDGRGAAEVPLPDLRVRLKESPPGTRVRMTVRSAGTEREVTLVLRDLL